MTIAEECVQRGAALLDQDKPGWDDRIDIAQLDISSGCKCVLGQVYGYYLAGLQVLNIKDPGGSYGFWGFGGVDNASLTAAWRELIARRRLEPLKVSEPVSEPFWTFGKSERDYAPAVQT